MTAAINCPLNLGEPICSAQQGSGVDFEGVRKLFEACFKRPSPGDLTYTGTPAGVGVGEIGITVV